MDLWICKNGDGLTRLTDAKPIWNEQYKTWTNDPTTSQYPRWMLIPAKDTKLKRGQLAKVKVLVVDYSAVEEQIFETEKQCAMCKEVKLKTEFYIQAQTASARGSNCKQCQRRRVKIDQARRKKNAGTLGKE